MKKSRLPRSTLPEPLDLEHKKDPGRPFPIVGIGASAGGLKAFEQFFSHLPAGPESKLAFVLVQHLSPDHNSILVELVQRFTQVKVVVAVDGEQIQTGRVYIIPPNRDLSIHQGKLRLTHPVAPHGLRLPIDFFLRSLAIDQGELAVGIILSGTGTDGTLGLKSIKEAGGLVMVQAPETADFDGMPRSALSTHLADCILAPDQMPERLLQYVQRASQPGLLSILAEEERVGDSLKEILHLLHTKTGHDFSAYKNSMLSRRIERRMAVHLIASLKDYQAFLEQNPAEIEALFADLLIGVTSFFRNPEAFEIVKEKAIPSILKDRTDREIVRVWVPGCSTGEEAYSLAILFQECLEQQSQDVKIQIFATDIDAQAIGKARAGVYPENIALDLPVDRLDRFFLHEDNSYSVRKNIREMVVFAEHNLIDDPPFSKLDLISCRNLLIYLNVKLQKKLIPLFHYALQDNGILFLGSAEGIGAYRNLFSTLDRKGKLYQSKGGSLSHNLMMNSSLAVARLTPPPQEMAESPKLKLAGREFVEKFLLAEYAPACVVINDRSDILYVHGHTGAFLEPAQGEVSNNLLRMARPGLRSELAALIRKAAADQAPAHLKGFQLKNNASSSTVNLSVYPINRPESMHGLQIVVFQEAGPAYPMEAIPGSQDSAVISSMGRDAWTKEEYLQTVIGELETANEELKSNSEEMQAVNEELQSANEELETAKEELQSVNEELNTINTELQNKVEELSQVSNDMKNLLSATGIATLFLDMQLNILRYTPATTRIINLIPGDIGRPVGDIVTNLEYDHLVQDAQAVLDTLIIKEVETQSRNGTWYLLRLLPYRTTDNVIQGVVVTFSDISEQKHAQEQLHTLLQRVKEERELAESIVATVRDPLVVLDSELQVVSANRSFYQLFQLDPGETVGQPLSLLDQKQWNIPELIKLLQDIRNQDQSFEGFRMETDLEKTGKRVLLLNARRVIRAFGQTHLILLAFEDVTPPDLVPQNSGDL